MNKIMINKEILSEILDENSLKREIAELLNDTIDNELIKDEPDCDLIDECIDILDNIENDDYSKVIPFINKTYKGRFTKKVWSILVACAILLAASIGTVAVGYTVKTIREERKTETTTQTTTVTSSETREIETETSETFAPAEPVRMILSFSPDFKDEYSVGEKPDFSGLNVSVELSDGTVKNIPDSEYVIVSDEDFGKTEKYETVYVNYESFTESFTVRVLRDEDTKVLNSLYAAFPDDFDFRTDDIENISLNTMEVYVVYSDSSEEKLESGEYSVEKEILPDGKTAMITVRYKSVYTQFGIKERS